MNVILFSQFLSTTKGGGEYVFSIIAKMLADNGNKVWIITNKIKGEQYLQHENIKIIFVPPLLEYRGGHPPGFKENITYSIYAFVRGFSLIKKEKIDILHSNNFAPALTGTTLSFLTRIPHITTIHDVFSFCKDFWKEWGKQENISKLNVLLGPFFERMLIKLKYVAIHTVSEASRDDLVKFGLKKPIYVIHNAIIVDRIDKPKLNPLQFIYIGRLVFYKNLEVAIRAIKILKQSYPEIRLIIVGGGPHKKKLVQFVNNLSLEKNITFMGHVSNEEKKKLLSTSLAMVFPSTCEGFGLVTLEAFSFEKPVLVPNVRPLSDVVENNKTGYIVSALDEKEWADAMEKIIKEPERAHQMGIAGKETLEKKYSLRIMESKILSMYNDFA